MRPSAPSFEQPVSDLLTASWLARQVQRVSRAGATAFRNSRLLPVAAAWTLRVRADAGVMLMVGAATHVVLLVIAGVPGGWLWMVPPAAAAASGMLLRAVRRGSSEPTA